MFVFFINGAKEKAPAAAGALLERLGWTPAGEPRSGRGLQRRGGLAALPDAAAVPKLISPDSWPPSSMTILP